jgi:hypothetical protein
LLDLECVMGHTELGVLPKSAKWQAVAALLAAPQVDVAQVAETTAIAAADRLNALRGDPAVAYCFWLLTRLASAARGPDFLQGVRALGIPVRPDDTAMALVARVADVSRIVLDRYPASGPFGEMAALSLRRALAETVSVENRPLFGASLADLERAFRRHSSPVQFGELAKRFFGEFYARTLRYYVERELQNRVGGAGLPTVAAANDFSDALTLHARETARYVEGFAAAWFDKHNWQSGGSIGPDETRAFVAHALRKMRTEIARESAEARALE